MRFPRYRAIFAVAALFAVVCSVIVAVSPKDIHWSPDCSAKYLAVKAIRFEHGFRYDVPYLGRSLDPDMHAVPIGETYYDIRNGEIRISWPELFPLLVYPFYRVFGWLGLFVLPILCGALSIYLTGRISELLRPRTGWIAAALTVLATPLAIYSTLLWEHTPALALMLWAIFLSIEFLQDHKWSKIALGSAAVGLAAAGLRTDVNIFFAAWAGALFFVLRGRDRWRLPFVAALGFVVGASPASALNWMTNGKILAANTMKNTPPPSLDYLKQVGIGIVPHFLAGKPVPAGDAWVVILGVVALVAIYYFLEGRLRSILMVGAIGAVTVGAAMVLADALSTHVDRMHGFLVMSPVLALGFLFVPDTEARRAMDGRHVVLLTFLILCSLNAAALALDYPNGWTSDANREWGPRYWLVVFPLLAILTAVNHEAFRAVADKTEKALLTLGAIALLGLSVVFELAGFAAIARVDEFHESLHAALERDRETPLLTDLFFVSALAPDAFFTRPSFYVLHHELWWFTGWFEQASAHGLSRFDFAMFGDPYTNMFIENPVAGRSFVVDGFERAGEMRIAHVHTVRLPDESAVPVLGAPSWKIAGVPNLGALNDPQEQPVDFSIWRAADGTWQLWSCIRGTKMGGATRLFHGWEASQLSDREWKPKGIMMEADPNVGETEGGLQAPYVFQADGVFHMFYGDWQQIRHATSTDGKSFTRLPNSESSVLGEGENGHARDPMVLHVGDTYYLYYSASPKDVGAVYMRASRDLNSWSDSKVVARGGRTGTGLASAECPFVVYRLEEKAFYLFRTNHYGAEARTNVYRSTDPANFGVDEDSHYFATLPVAAPEVVVDGEKTYLASLLSGLDGIQLSPLEWIPNGSHRK